MAGSSSNRLMASDAAAPLAAAVIAARALFLLNGAAWILFGSLSLLTANPASTDQMAVMRIVAALAFANAAVLLWIGWSLAKRQRRIYYLSLAMIAVNAVLCVTDDIGLIDLLFLCLNLGLLVLLVATRSHYTQ
jgi:hypothetical protein